MSSNALADDSVFAFEQLEGKKMKDLFCHGLTNLCSARFVGKKIITLLLYCAKRKITEHMISFKPSNKCVGYVLLSLSTWREDEGKPFEFSDREENI